MSEKKREQAERLYEALSGVDPELLAESEKEIQPGKKIIPFYRYARICAACLALLIVGGACYATLTNGGKKYAANDSKSYSSGQGVTAAEKSERSMDGKKEKHDNVATAQAEAADNDSAGGAAGESPSQVMSEGLIECEVESENAVPAYSDSERLEENSELTAQNKAETDKFGFKSFLKYELKARGTSPDAYVTDKQMEIDFGSDGKALLKNEVIASFIYGYFMNVDKEITEDRQFEDATSILIYDKNGSMTDSFTVSGEYLKLMTDTETYRILDPEYDYAGLRNGLWKATQEEE